MSYRVRYREAGKITEHGDRFEASIYDTADFRLVALVPVGEDAERIVAALNRESPR